MMLRERIEADKGVFERDGCELHVCWFSVGEWGWVVWLGWGARARPSTDACAQMIVQAGDHRLGCCRSSPSGMRERGAR
jgi:hypothetical protein